MRFTPRQWLGNLAVLLLVSACEQSPSSTDSNSSSLEVDEAGLSKVRSGRLDQTMFERNQLPPLDRLAPNGLRVSISVHEQRLSFVVDFKPLPQGCLLYNGGSSTEDMARRCLKVEADYFQLDADPQSGGASVRSTARFEIPEEEFRNAHNAFNEAAEPWLGERFPDLGGTWVEVEQFVEGQARSLASNSRSAFAPTALLLSKVHGLLLGYAPTGTVPRSDSFAVNDPVGRWPCNGAGLNTPDPDGFGVGADPCAQFRREEATGRPSS